MDHSLIKYFNTYFTTATILNWYPLLARDDLKDIIIDSFSYCVKNDQARILAFVIMETHFHVVWHILDPFELPQIQRNMLKYTAQTIKNQLVREGNDEILRHFTVKKKDRHIQIWKRNPLSIEILFKKVLDQKINYIHANREQKGESDVEYKYSSAYFYATGERNWDFL